MKSITLLALGAIIAGSSFTTTAAKEKPEQAITQQRRNDANVIGHNAGSGTETPKAVNTPTFIVVNAKIAYDIPLASQLKMQLSCGAQNIFNAYQNDFDKGWNRDSDYIYGPSQPRSLYAGIKISY